MGNKKVKFIYLTDTHIGANPIGFHQQPSYPAMSPRFFKQLETVIKDKKIDFLIHGGDLVDSCKLEYIQLSKAAMTLSVPSYLCLGNHDLDHTNALKMWMENAPELFLNESPVYNIVKEPVVVHIIPNHWERDCEYYWESAQEPYLTQKQISFLEENIRKFPNLIHVLVTHNPVFAVSKHQTGLSNVIHDVPHSFRKTITDLTKRYPQIKLVLSGHNHINTLNQVHGTTFASMSSFSETPFEYKIIEITNSSLNIKTKRIDISKLDGFQPDYNSNRKYVQGRKRDRFIAYDF